MIDFQNASLIKLHMSDFGEYADRVKPLLVPGEDVVWTFKAMRDGVVFTNKRIIAINVQGITGKKIDFTSLLYKNIQAFSVETAGTFDLDSELDLWFSGLGKVRFEFTKGVNIIAISNFIAQKTLI